MHKLWAFAALAAALIIGNFLASADPFSLLPQAREPAPNQARAYAESRERGQRTTSRIPAPCGQLQQQGSARDNHCRYARIRTSILCSAGGKALRYGIGVGPGGLYLVRGKDYRAPSRMAGLDAASGNDRAPAVPAAVCCRWWGAIRSAPVPCI